MNEVRRETDIELNSNNAKTGDTRFLVITNEEGREGAPSEVSHQEPPSKDGLLNVEGAGGRNSDVATNMESSKNSERYLPIGDPDPFAMVRPRSPAPTFIETIPDVNTYQQKKNLAQGMMDLALLSANANQLRYVLESSSSQPYYYPSVVLISLSILFQTLVGIGLIMNSRYNVKDEREICIADKINNITVLGIFIITLVNVFITSFGVGAPTVSVATVPRMT